MKWKPYPAYKDSGVEWLGAIPIGWGVTQVGRLFEIRKCIAGELGHDVLSITQQGIRIRDTESNDGQLSMDYSKYQVVAVGDFAMNHMDLITGFVDIARTPGVTSPDYRVFRLRDSSCADSRYFLLVFQDAYRRKLLFPFGQGSSQLGRWRLPTDAFRSYPIPRPPLSEQTRISAFLDRETARLDALISKQERLIALLQEKRQALISHAVTKGLNADAPMKDSGVEWLGQVPAHWRISRCRHYVTVLSGFAFSSSGFTHDENDTRLLRGVNVGVSKISWADTVYWRREESDQLGTFEMRSGNIVLGMDRPVIADGIRVAKLTDKDVPCLLLQRVASLETNDLLEPDYLLLLLSSRMFEAHFSPETTGVSVPHISPEQIATFVIPVPPIDEQLQVIAYAAREGKRLDVLIDRSRRSIELLREHRTALISAAVTGKIDVRDAA